MAIKQLTVETVRRYNLMTLEKAFGTLEALAEASETSAAYLSQIKNEAKDSKTGRPRSMGSSLARKIELNLQMPTGMLDNPFDIEEVSVVRDPLGHSKINVKFISDFKEDSQQPDLNNPDLFESLTLPLSNSFNASESGFELIENESNSNVETFEISYVNARGSCGGGSLELGDEVKGTLVKEATFFAKYKVKPKDLVVVYADGDSMSNFIVDGDMVIFDTSKKNPISGKIFLINHPDGLKIKQLRREIDGSWLLESLHPDKRTYPDEKIAPGMTDLLSIVGQFVYRQGG